MYPCQKTEKQVAGLIGKVVLRVFILAEVEMLLASLEQKMCTYIYLVIYLMFAYLFIHTEKSKNVRTSQGVVATQVCFPI